MPGRVKGGMVRQEPEAGQFRVRGPELRARPGRAGSRPESQFGSRDPPRANMTTCFRNMELRRGSDCRPSLPSRPRTLARTARYHAGPQRLPFMERAVAIQGSGTPTLKTI